MVHCAGLAKPSPTAISDHSSGKPGKMPLQPAVAMGKEAGRCSLPISPGTCAGRGRRSRLYHGLIKMISRYHFVKRCPLNVGETPKPWTQITMISASPGEINTIKSKKASGNVLWQFDSMLAKPVKNRPSRFTLHCIYTHTQIQTGWKQHQYPLEVKQ